MAIFFRVQDGIELWLWLITSNQINKSCLRNSLYKPDYKRADLLTSFHINNKDKLNNFNAANYIKFL